MMRLFLLLAVSASMFGCKDDSSSGCSPADVCFSQCIDAEHAETGPPATECLKVDGVLTCVWECSRNSDCDPRWFDGCKKRTDGGSLICRLRSDIDVTPIQMTEEDSCE